MTETHVFILSGEYEDSQDRHLLRFYGKSTGGRPVEILIDHSRPVFFVPRDAELPSFPFPVTRSEVELKSFSGVHAAALYFRTQRELYEARDILRRERCLSFESDVHPCDRYLMERFIHGTACLSGEPETGGPLLRFRNPKMRPASDHEIPLMKIASIDIETAKPAKELYSIAVHTVMGEEYESKKVFMKGAEYKEFPEQHLIIFPDEKEVFSAFLEWFAREDPDFVIGWHVVGFDLAFLDKRSRELGINFPLGRGGRPLLMKKRKNGADLAIVPGRVVMDGPVALRSAFYNFEDFKLETVAQEMLGEGKAIDNTKNKVEEITRMFREEKQKLAVYNLQDTVLVTRIFQKTKLIPHALKRTQISGLLIEQSSSSTGAFDYIYLPRLHRKGYVAPNTEDVLAGEHAAGGHVIPPKAGLHENVVLFDFKSLYPSIIRTFKVDPLSRLRAETKTLTTPKGFRFSRTEHILPDFIESLMKQRELAKKENDAPLSQAIKILMNSFYGVMGSGGCRFYHPELPSAITSTGQWLLMESQRYLERRDCEVVYGDTDSLFVKVAGMSAEDHDETAVRLAKEINAYWHTRLKREFQLESFLEVEYERYYKKLFLPLARNKDGGAKKRYAGLAFEHGKDSLQFVGMEFVRSDWTKLAKEFQEELYRRFFYKEEFEGWMKEYVKAVKEGRMNGKLVYRKRLVKTTEEYTKNVPPHVRAAKLLGRPVRTVEYVMTLRGPVPVELPHEDIDYNHYIEKQLQPIADSVLETLGKSFGEITGQAQLSLF